MLRPTESATVFLQQLGRGLRWAEGKRVLTVLDFVGQARREYRYDVRYRALLGGTRHQVRRAVEADFPLLPPGCALKLDRIAKKHVLHNLKDAVYNARTRLAEDLRVLGPNARLREFMRHAGAELDDVYARPQAGHCFTELRQRAGFERRTSPLAKNPLLKSIGKLIHVDDCERLEVWRDILDAETTDPISGLEGRNRRLGLMLFAILGGRRQSTSEADQLLNKVRESEELYCEIKDLLDVLTDRIRTVSNPIVATDVVPLASHATYTLGEIIAAHGRTNTRGELVLPQGGVLWDQATQTDLLFVHVGEVRRGITHQRHVTLTTQFPRTLFNWESQNSASPDTPTGRRYVEQRKRGTHVILFVRERKRNHRGQTLPYHCLGRAQYQSHESERPMKILWKLDRPMPGRLYQFGKVVAG